MNDIALANCGSWRGGDL